MFQQKRRGGRRLRLLDGRCRGRYLSPAQDSDTVHSSGREGSAALRDSPRSLLGGDRWNGPRRTHHRDSHSCR